MRFLRGFDKKVRALPGNDFLIIDYDQRDFARMYRVGERAIGAELGTGPEKSSVAPWSRLILYQGMTTGDSIDLQRKDQSDSSTQLIPYFEGGDPNSSLWSHISSHMQLKCRDTTTNPYLDLRLGFHTTFYEVRETNSSQMRELWKYGPLYDHPLGWSFRKSAYTLYTPRFSDVSAMESSGHSHSIKGWTALLLSPEGFFSKNGLNIPAEASVREKAQILGEWLGKLTPLGSEMALIGQGMRRISDRWAEFQSFFDFILDHGDSLMQPSEHDNLLFDDGSFSRSRRYFWVIDCLSEFELSITDNIVQWEMYRDARIKPFVDSGQLPAVDYQRYNNAEEYCHVLKHQREYFRRKLDSTKALRDALFNASAVIESRASTRLGENVKILTFVSIFFLPLAFCTSLWSINDKFSSTSFIIVIVIVALTTYAMVFNVNSLVHTFRFVYDTKKRRLVNDMKSDPDERWKQRGQRFEVFRPRHEDPEPSEWYITLYAILNLATFLGFGRPDRRLENRALEDSSLQSSSSHFSCITNYFTRRRIARKPELSGDSWRQDEPWVL
ncbi:hypothetical protein GJ744_009991 [Endocarpon pusillum]|uniref:Uncharacterized protein n=1 Tax=Endocarpon pusillum TaxID=364733 RepID=A0A8H7AH93_9EURO|nr:hypothetical protein GJ744_009991 [Endocarpon pusillum]